MQKTLIEDTYQNLYNNTVSGFPSRKSSSQRVQLLTTAFIPSVNNASLEVRAKTKTDDASYDTIIYFENVEYVGEEDLKAISFLGSDNNKYYILPIQRNSTVKVGCTCLDFHWKFAVWNDAKDSLYGAPPDPYLKKTNKQPANPRKLPGLCKHLIKFFDYLKLEKIII